MCDAEHIEEVGASLWQGKWYEQCPHCGTQLQHDPEHSFCDFVFVEEYGVCCNCEYYKREHDDALPRLVEGEIDGSNN